MSNNESRKYILTELDTINVSNKYLKQDDLYQCIDFGIRLSCFHSYDKNITHNICLIRYAIKTPKCKRYSIKKQNYYTKLLVLFRYIFSVYWNIGSLGIYPFTCKPNDTIPNEELTEVELIEYIALMQRISDLEAMLEHHNAQKPEKERAGLEQIEFLKPIQKYNQPILVFEDYDFVFSYPTQSEIMQKYQSKESLQAFCHRVKKFQSMLLEVSGEIKKRPAFARRMHQNYPDIMKKLKRLIELKLPIIHIEE